MNQGAATLMPTIPIDQQLATEHAAQLAAHQTPIAGRNVARAYSHGGLDTITAAAVHHYYQPEDGDINQWTDAYRHELQDRAADLTTRTWLVIAPTGHHGRSGHARRWIDPDARTTYPLIPGHAVLVATPHPHRWTGTEADSHGWTATPHHGDNLADAAHAAAVLLPYRTRTLEDGRHSVQLTTSYGRPVGPWCHGPHALTEATRRKADQIIAHYREWLGQ